MDPVLEQSRRIGRERGQVFQHRDTDRRRGTRRYYHVDVCQEEFGQEYRRYHAWLCSPHVRHEHDVRFDLTAQI